MTFIVLIVALVFVACTAETATRTVSSREPTIASSPTPTRPPMPTRTPTPTRTPFPTLTPSPTPTFDELFELTQEIAYDDLFRNNELHVGKEVRFVAKIVQVIENPDRGDEFYLRGNVTPGDFLWDDAVLLEYTGPRLLEDDIVEMIGIVEGLFTYEAVLGNQVTVPHILVVKSRRIMESGKPSLTPTPTPTSIPVLQLPTWVPASSSATPSPTSTPLPTQSPTLSPTPVPVLSSMEKPVPFGQSFEVKNDDPTDHWEITVIDVVSDSTDEVLAENMFNDPPEEDTQFFMVKVRVKYLGLGSNEFSWGSRLKAVGERRVVYSRYDNSCGVLPNPVPDSELFTGGEVEGNACWQIESSEAASLVMFIEPENRRSDAPRAWFSLNGGGDLPTDVEETLEEPNPTDLSATPSSSSNSSIPAPITVEPSVESSDEEAQTSVTPAPDEPTKTPMQTPDCQGTIIGSPLWDTSTFDDEKRTVVAVALGVSVDQLPDDKDEVSFVFETEMGSERLIVRNSGIYTVAFVPYAHNLTDYRILEFDEVRFFGTVGAAGVFQELTGRYANFEYATSIGILEGIGIVVQVPANQELHVELIVVRGPDRGSSTICF